jgi:hypothetical protein
MGVRAYFFGLCVLFWSFATASSQLPGKVTAIDVKKHIVHLADDKLEGRGGGYKGERSAAEYIAREFKSIGLKPAGTKAYFQEFRFHPYHSVRPWELMTSRNVLGMIEGSDPVLKKQVVVIGAHYDGQGRAGQADPTRQPPSAEAKTDEIWNSANDNATGVAAMIEIARAMKSANPKRSVLFAAFGAEEHGMTGSIYYVNHPTIPLADHIAMINLEKLGRSPETPITVAGVMSSKAWPALTETSRNTTGAKINPSPIAFPDSDHYPFSARGVPAVLIYVSSNADAHQPTDSADKIDFDRTAEAGRLALALVQGLADQTEKPDFVRSPMLDPGLIAHLATGAEVDIAKLPAGQGGLKVTGVISGLPASAAGMREGDLVIEMSGRRFAREEPLTKLMAAYQDLLQGKLGTTIPIKLLRDKQELNVTMNLRP